MPDETIRKLKCGLWMLSSTRSHEEVENKM